MQSKMLDIGLGRPPVQVFEAGEGDPVLFLHGAGGIMPDDRFIAALATKYRVHAPLLPGYGESMGEERLQDMLDISLHTADVADALDLGKLLLVGHSMGGMIAAEMAALAPRDYDRLVLIAPAGLWLDDKPVADLFSKLPFELPELLFHDVEFGTELMTSGLDLEDPQFLIDFLVINARRLGMAGKILFPIPDRGLSRRLYRIKARTLLIWGESDKLIDPAYGAAFAEAIADATLVNIPDAGHLVNIEKPDAVLEAITGFAG